MTFSRTHKQQILVSWLKIPSKSWAISFSLSLKLDQRAVTVCGPSSEGGQRDQKDKDEINEVLN